MPTRPSGTDILDMSLTDADMSASNLDGSPGVFSMRTLGTGSQQAAAGDDPRFNSIASDPNPSFLVLALTSSLNNERILSGGLGINLLDLGPNDSAILDLNVVGQNGITITTGSEGEIIFTGGAQTDPSASFVVMGLTASLPNERVLSGGLGISLFDGGANGAAILDLNIVASGSVSLVTGANGAIEITGSGITDFEHKRLRHLIHFIDEGPADGFTSLAFKEILPAGDPFPTSVTWYTDSSKTAKIVEKTIGRVVSGNVNPTPITWEMYDHDGTTVLATVTDEITYSGIFESTRTRTIS